MKANYLATSLCLAPALAAPLFSTSTVLVAGSSAKTVVVRPAHQAALEETAQVAFDGESISRSSSSASVVSTTTTTDDAPASTILDAERPLTTQELMELTQASHKKGAAAAGGASKIKISVGTLVVPGGGHPRAGSSVVAQFLDPKNPRPFLVSGYYIPAQRLDVWAAGVIVSFFLVVVGLELWGLVRQRYVFYGPLSSTQWYGRN